MTMKNWNLIIILLITIISFTQTKYHFLNNIIIIEFMTSTILMMMFHLTSATNTENYLNIIILIMMVMESVLGLSLMVNMLRTHSSDYIKVISSEKF